MSSSMNSTPSSTPRSGLLRNLSKTNFNTSSNSDLLTNSNVVTSSCYHKEYYSSLLYDENPNGKNYINIPSIPIFSEKELQTHFEKIVASFRKTEDWQLRINALETLQGIAKGGDAMKFDCFISLLKNCHELVELQILDLRSAICKEACRTVAVLSQNITNSAQTSSLSSFYTSTGSSTSSLTIFYNLLELWLPKLFKQTGVKIQVIAMSADKAIRLIINSFSANSDSNNMSSSVHSSSSSSSIITTGYPKLFYLIADQLLNSKTAVIRKYAVEYACLAVALWSFECIEK